MSKGFKSVTTMRGAVIAAVASVVGSSASAAVVVDGSFADWAAVSTINVDVSGGTTVDFAEVKASSDEDFVYLYYRLHAATNPQAAPGGGVFLGIDSDFNPSTGFDIFGFGAVGSEAGWQNDFPFEQSTGVFNSGTLSNATLAIAPYSTDATEVEMSIPIIATRNSDSSSVFTPGQTFGFAFYTVGSGDEDFISGNYSVPIPEPASLALLAVGGGLMPLRPRHHR